MDKEKVARELVKLAKELTAVRGMGWERDVETHLNAAAKIIKLNDKDAARKADRLISSIIDLIS